MTRLLCGKPHYLGIIDDISTVVRISCTFCKPGNPWVVHQLHPPQHLSQLGFFPHNRLSYQGFPSVSKHVSKTCLCQNGGLRPTLLREHPMPALPSPVLPCRIALRQMCPGHQVPNFCLPSQLLGNVSNMFPLHSALRHSSHFFPFRMRAASRCRRLWGRYQLPTTLVSAIQKRFSRIQPAHRHVLSARRVLFPHCR
ncbi:hypothetical protein BS50DRAFT_17748 [Corynespora cassiicola Philippines]|uniref:Uncharacterized protein n=1 Tax=Corynespora cassiicola Philippines TaxID=1448308 RepID=A0A2T2PA06_CORCC|nr:hypothetical protein BS50DRAFT_17748 [Corynespora cassiicola Philippines]